VVLGPAAPPPVVDLGATRTVGTRGVGDVGALIWVAEQLDLIAHIDRACGNLGARDGPSVGELAVAVAILPLGHAAAEQALQMAARRGAMKPLSGKLQHVRAARMRTAVGKLDRTLVVVESEELLVGQKRGIAVALRRQLEQTRLVQRVLCTDQHNWSTGRIVYAFRGQWNVEELFRRAKKGGVVSWGPRISGQTVRCAYTLSPRFWD